jgi:hypothetical protein
MCSIYYSSLIIFISGIVLEKVAEYFYYHYKHRNSENVPDMEIPPELCLELLMAADYLDSDLLVLPWHTFANIGFLSLIIARAQRSDWRIVQWRLWIY